jgi:hypothetical protein
VNGGFVVEKTKSLKILEGCLRNLLAWEELSKREGCYTLNILGEDYSIFDIKACVSKLDEPHREAVNEVYIYSRTISTLTGLKHNKVYNIKEVAAEGLLILAEELGL